MPTFIQICSFIIEKILENRQKRPNLGTWPVWFSNFKRSLAYINKPRPSTHFYSTTAIVLPYDRRINDVDTMYMK